MDGKASLKGAWLSHANHLNFGGHNHIPGTADRLRRCQLSSLEKVIKIFRGRFVQVDKTLTCLEILGCELHQNAFGDRAPPGPAAGAIALPQTL